MRLVGLEWLKKSVRMRRQSDGRAELSHASEANQQTQSRVVLTVGSPQLFPLPPPVVLPLVLTPRFSLARSLASGASRKSWVSTSEVSAAANSKPLERRKSFVNTFLAPLRNTFRSSNGARPTPELVLPCTSEAGPSPPSSDQDQASLSGLTNQLSPSTPNLSPSSPTLPLPSPTRRRWTASGQRTPATPATDPSLSRTRHLSNPLPPPTRPIPPIPYVHFVPPPSDTLPMPMPIPMPLQKSISTEDCGPSTPIDDSYGLLEAAAAAASKARPKARQLHLAVTFPELASSLAPAGYPATATAHSPSRPRATMYTLSHSARSTSAIPTGTSPGVRPERPTADDSEGDLIDPYLLSSGEEGRSSVRAHHTAAPTVSSLSSILPWLQDHDLDSIMPALSNAE
jgi:hypothetical protein